MTKQQRAAIDRFHARVDRLMAAGFERNGWVDAHAVAVAAHVHTCSVHAWLHSIAGERVSRAVEALLRARATSSVTAEEAHRVLAIAS